MERMRKPVVFITALLIGLSSCRSTGDIAGPNQKLADNVDLKRFLGKWYVHGFTPTFLDKNAVNATETYELGEDGKINTTYAFRKHEPGGKQKTYKPIGWVYDKRTSAEWRMRFFGLFTAPYYILYVDENYETTVVGHPKKELAWIMSRSPQVDSDTYNRLLDELKNRDYKLERFRRMQQEW